MDYLNLENIMVKMFHFHTIGWSCNMTRFVYYIFSVYTLRPHFRLIKVLSTLFQYNSKAHWSI